MNPVTGSSATIAPALTARRSHTSQRCGTQRPRPHCTLTTMHASAIIRNTGEPASCHARTEPPITAAATQATRRPRATHQSGRSASAKSRIARREDPASQ